MGLDCIREGFTGAFEVLAVWLYFITIEQYVDMHFMHCLMYISQYKCLKYTTLVVACFFKIYDFMLYLV